MFDTKRFLKDQFRTPVELHTLMQSYGVDVPREGTVSQWFQRASVPSTWFPVLLAVLEMDRGHPVSVVEYMEG
jgi:hypothetical protein